MSTSFDTAAASAEPARTGRARVLVLDLMRLLAALQMVQGHTIDVVLAPQFRHGTLHALWLGSRGLTSVAFLFVAGLAFGLTALQAGPHAGGPGSAHRLRRAGMLVLLGYALHLPLGLLSGSSSGDFARLLGAAYAVDILQCMGIGLAALEGLALALRRPRAIRLACGLLGLGVLAAAPALHTLLPAGPLAPLAAYVTPRSGSLFPLFPWAAHLFLGVAASAILLAEPRRRALRLALAGALLLALALGLRRAELSLPGDHLARLGWVLSWGALLCLLERAAASWPGWLLRLSRETLFIYVFHVLLVYGDQVGLAAWIGRTLGPLPAIAAAACMIALSFGAAQGRMRLLLALRARRAATRTGLAGTTAPG